MINAGFNPLQQISEKTGKSIAQLKVEMSKGAISAEMVQQAFIDATSAGGKFYNMSENASKTINGQISMMQDAIDSAFNEIGMKSEGVIIRGIQAATSLIQNYEKIGKVLAGLVATYGAYRTAVFLATTATSKHTVAEIALTNVRIAATKAQKALNAAMLTNPFVAFATAVAATTAAIVAYERNADAAKVAQRELDKAMEESQEAATGELRGLAKLKGELAACEKGTDKYNEVKNKIVAGYGKYYEGLDEEIEEVGLLDETYKKLTESITASFSARQYDKFIKEQELSLDTNLAKNYDKLYDRLIKDLGDEKGSEVYTKIRDALMLGEELDVDTLATLDEIQNKGKLNADSRIDGWIENIRNAMGAFQKIQQEAKVKFGIKDGEGSGQNKGKGEEGEEPNYGKSYAAAKAKYEADLKAFKEVEKDRSKFTVKEYEERKKAKESSEEAFKKLGGKTEKQESSDANAIKNASVKVLETDRKVAKDRQTQYAQLSRQFKELKIKNEEDIAKATVAKREFDNEREIQDLERQKENYIEGYIKAEKEKHEARERLAAAKAAEQGKTYIKQDFDESAARAAAEASETAVMYSNIIVETKKNQKKSELDAEKDANREYLIEFGSFQEKLLALTAQWNDKIAAASGENEKKLLTAQRDKVLDELKKSQNKAYQNIFKDPTKMSLSTVRDAIALAQKEIKAITEKGALGEEDIEKLKILQEAVDKLQSYSDSAPFAGFGDGLDGLVGKFNQILEIQKRINTASSTGNKEAQKAAEEELEATKERLKKNLAGVGVDAFSSAMTQAAESLFQIAEISGDPKLKQLADTLGGVANVVSSTAMGAAAGGWIGAIVGGVTAILGELVSATTEFFVAGETNRKAVNDYEYAIRSLASVVDSSKFDTMFGESTWGHIHELNRALEEARKNYKRLNEEAYTVEEYTVGEVVTPDVLPSMTVTTTAKALGSATIKAKGKNKKDYSGTLSEIFPDLFNEDGTLRKDKIDDAREALKMLKNMELKDDQGVPLLEEAIAAAETVEQRMEELKEAASDYLGGVGQALGDSIVDGILKGEDALDSFNDYAGGIIEQIARDFASSWMIDMYLKKFEDDMTAAMEMDSSTAVANVVQSIVAGLPAVLEQGEEAAKSILDLTKGTDYDLYEKYKEDDAEGAQQEASRKGYEALSEDTGSELVGRALAQYESNLRMEEAMLSVKGSVDIMSLNQIQIRDIAAESRALIADSFLELQQIRENTGAIVKPILAMRDKMVEWDTYIKSL